ncbi:hypothetical protein J2S09_003343 [Bacillus fengqiuensis]|nr:hypothetical protein [Bacillus fengqiuensis]
MGNPFSYGFPMTFYLVERLCNYCLLNIAERGEDYAGF